MWPAPAPAETAPDANGASTDMDDEDVLSVYDLVDSWLNSLRCE